MEIAEQLLQIKYLILIRDKIYGKCNNPYREFNKAQKRICEDKERAAGPDGEVDDPINLTKLIIIWYYVNK